MADRRKTSAYIAGNTVRKTVEHEYYPIHQRAARKSYRARRNRDKALQMTLPYVIVLAATCICVVGMAVNYLQVRSSINTTMKEVANMQSELLDLKDSNDTIEGEINKSIDLNHIYDVATNELGMVYASEDQIVHYEKSEREYVRQNEDIPE